MAIHSMLVYLYSRKKFYLVCSNALFSLTSLKQKPLAEVPNDQYYSRMCCHPYFPVFVGSSTTSVEARVVKQCLMLRHLRFKTNVVVDTKSYASLVLY